MTAAVSRLGLLVFAVGIVAAATYLEYQLAKRRAGR